MQFGQLCNGPFHLAVQFQADQLTRQFMNLERQGPQGVERETIGLAQLSIGDQPLR